MKQQDHSSFLAVPADFVEEVERAEAGRHLGDLDLLAAEVRGFEWESEGLRVVGRAQLRIKAYEGASGMKETSRVLLFTGHMIDAPGRKEPRFPPGKEGVAREAIAQAVSAETARPGGVAYGIAGGASGGDILFHEICAELGIPTHLYLALPKGDYIAESVEPAGPEWVERFNQLYQKHPETRVLASSEDLPRWLSEKRESYTIWQRNNLWMLYNALADEGKNLTLIALWNGKEGDGPGGTGDLVAKVKERGAKVIHLNTEALFGLPTASQ